MTFSKALLQQMYTTFAYYLPNMKNRHKTTFIYCSQMYIWSDISKSHLMLKSWDLHFFVIICLLSISTVEYTLHNEHYHLKMSSSFLTGEKSHSQSSQKTDIFWSECKYIFNVDIKPMMVPWDQNQHGKCLPKK